MRYRLRVLNGGLRKEDARAVASYCLKRMNFQRCSIEKFEVPRELFSYFYPQGLDTSDILAWFNFGDKVRKDEKLLFLTNLPLVNIDPLMLAKGNPQFTPGCAGFRDRTVQCKVAIASTFGMGKKYLERTAKNALHELGETLGLGHCKDKKCFMRGIGSDELWMDLEGLKNLFPEIDIQKSFCLAHRKKLEEILEC